jgi:hypothetical protein
MSATKKLLIAMGVFLVICVVVFALLPNPQERRLRAPERKQWKAQALAQINATSRNAQMVSNEVTVLQAEAGKNSDDGWIGTNVVLMANGEYLVYSHIDAKQDRRISDLFLARGSDGKWYYSTYHFCIHMVTLRMGGMGESRRGSILEFASEYALREFDGQSDECLKKTWPVKR